MRCLAHICLRRFSNKPPGYCTFTRSTQTLPEINNKLYGLMKATILASALVIPANTACLSMGVKLYRLIWKLTVCKDENKLEKMSVAKETGTWLKDTFLWRQSCEISKMSLRDSLAWRLGDGVSDSRCCVRITSCQKVFFCVYLSFWDTSGINWNARWVPPWRKKQKKKMKKWIALLPPKDINSLRSKWTST